MQSYGVSGSSLDLLNDYFSGRENRVRLGNYTSNWKPLFRGCPQGSSQGPIMWNFYQNDLFYEPLSSKLSAYADDHQIHSNDLDVNKVINALEVDGELMAGWYKKNHLQGNLSKYQCMVLSRSESDVDKQVRIDGYSVKQSSNINLLGVILDDKLDFSEHIKKMC